MLNKIVEACRFLLKNFPEAQDTRDYLDSRISKESQEKFQFGYFPRTNDLKVLTDMIGESALRESELFYSRDIEDCMGPRKLSFSYFEDYPLILPYKNNYGDSVALVGRTLLGSTEMKEKRISKYKNTKETKLFKKGNLLFGLYENKQSILDKNCVYVVEGQFDVIKASERGFTNIIALGSNNMSSYQFSVISRYTDNIFLLLDNDEAGNKGRKLAVGKFGKLANIQNFYLPESYKDIDEYLTKCNDDSMSFEVRV